MFLPRLTACLVALPLVGAYVGLKSRAASAPKAAIVRATPVPVAWWKGENDARDENGRAHGTVHSGVRFAPGVDGNAFVFDGTAKGGVSIPDIAPLRLTNSITVDVWIRPDAFPSSAKRAAMILFRGDRRDARDPYYLCVLSSGKVRWAIDQTETRRVTVDEGGNGGTIAPGKAGLEAAISANRWTHVTGTLNDDTGEMRLYINGALSGSIVTPIRPLAELEEDQQPGIAIGNHSGLPNPRTDYAFVGGVDELKIYDSVVLPDEQ